MWLRDLSGYDTDKYPDLLPIYERFLRPWRNAPHVLLEIGVKAGASLLMWRDLLPKALIVGLDVERAPRGVMSKRVKVYRGAQEDTALLDRIAMEMAPDGFGIIIDDASHIGSLTRISFQHLFQRHLKPGGVYAIEDWGTRYWDSWPDGRGCPPPPTNLSNINYFPSHQYGMVGFIKELIDEVGIEDATKKSANATSFHSGLIAELHVFPGLVIAIKAGDRRVRSRHGRASR